MNKNTFNAIVRHKILYVLLFITVSFSVQAQKLSLKIDNESSEKVPEPTIQNTETKNAKFKISGLIKDDADEIIVGVTVQNKTTGKCTASGLDGSYIIEAAVGDQLIFSFIGMQTQNVKVDGKYSTLNVTLNPDSIALENIVVTGYQTLSKERAAGAYAVISQEKIANKLQTNVVDRLEGMIAGLSNNRGKVEVRGVSTIRGNKNPLYVVDGVPFEGVPGNSVTPLDVINPSDVVNITVLKDATAASIYGARSANGVIVITTRSGEVGKTKVNYSGTVNFQGLRDLDYENRMNSSELVDYQLSLYESFPKLSRKGEREWQNDVQVLLLDRVAGKISEDEFKTALVPFRKNNRNDQVIDEFLRKYRVKHQHNLSFSGGSEIYKYSLSANYTGTAPYEKAQYENRLGFNLKNTFNFFKWLQIDAGLLGSQMSKDYDSGISGNGLLNSGGSSYYMLRDEQGNPMKWYLTPGGSQYKSQFEIDRLKSVGLQDENYFPVNQLATEHYNAKTNYLNLNIGARIKIIDGLNVNLRYQLENTNGFTKEYCSKDSYNVKRMVNDATQTDPKGVHKFNIPVGGTILQSNLDNFSYTLRGQVDYNKQINKSHYIQVLAGTELRKVVATSNGFYRVGYDDNNLTYSKIDELALSKMLSGTQSVYGNYTFSNKTPSTSYIDNRYFSLYSNASWSFKEKLTLTGSIRIDQSNLFGTDPKFQYKPLWSAGAHYVVLKDYRNWLDRLVARVTYGINGNIPKENGPYLLAKANGNDYYTGENLMYISSPPNPELRWEKTKVFNVGVDFNMFKNRLTGSVDFYNKNTSDLLGSFSTDPTLGWTSVVKNFGAMYNRGVEISLNSLNINTNKFKWSTNLLFSYNKNEITRIEASGESALDYYNGLNNRKGYPMGALFSVRYAGLNDKGAPIAYKADGTTTTKYSDLSKEDLVYSGTYNPPYNASLTNTLSYKGIDLSFMFVYTGGHVIRDVAAGYVITSHPIYITGNADKNMINYWRKSGDENLQNINPAFMFQSTVRDGENIWKAADKHVQRGDFIKLRDLSIAYNLPSSILKKTFIRGAKISFQARNLFYWSANDKGLDPEVWEGYNLSPTRGTHLPAEFTFGLNINF